MDIFKNFWVFCVLSDRCVCADSGNRKLCQREQRLLLFLCCWATLSSVPTHYDLKLHWFRGALKYLALQQCQYQYGKKFSGNVLEKNIKCFKSKEPYFDILINWTKLGCHKRDTKHNPSKYKSNIKNVNYVGADFGRM